MNNNLDKDASCRDIFWENKSIAVPALKSLSLIMKYSNIKYKSLKNEDVHHYNTRNKKEVRTKDKRHSR